MKNFFAVLPPSLLALFLVLAVQPAHAVHLLQTAGTTFFENPGARRIQIQSEMSGIEIGTAAQAIVDSVGGSQVGTNTRQALVRGTRIGDVSLLLRANGIRLTTGFLTYDQVSVVQQMMTALKASGAKGASRNSALGLSMGLEVGVGTGQPSAKELKVVVDFMRDYLRPPHRRQILAGIAPVAGRRDDLGVYSQGFMKRLLDPHYAPTAAQLYFDYFYRQSLEYSGQPKAWSMSESEVRKAIANLHYPLIGKVIDRNSLQISSLLMTLAPNDPYTAMIEKSGRLAARSEIIIRDWNSSFDIATPVRQIFGLWAAAERYGYYDHDRLLAELSQIPRQSIRDLRTATLRKKAKASDPTVFRYFLEKRDYPGSNEYTKLKRLYPHQITGYLDYETFGTSPALIPGESVVFHRRPQHRFNILGKYNPALINASIMQALENKYVEAIFWNTYAPQSVSRTKILSDYGDALKNPSLLVERLNQDFPHGWVLKGVWDFATQIDGIVTNSKDVAGEIAKYRASDFDSYRAKMLAELAGRDPEYIVVELIKHPGYFGWKLSEMLANAHQTIVQERVDIEREYRVPVIAGRVLSDGSTVDRYNYRKDLPEGSYLSSRNEVAGAEQWAQKQIDRLPIELRGMTMGLDVAKLKNGGYVFIETNPGGNDGFVAEDAPALSATNRFLRRYPKLVGQGSAIDRGLSPSEQIDFLKTFFAQHNIDMATQYPGMSFLKDRIEDPMFVAQPVETQAAQAVRNDARRRPQPAMCREIFSSL